MSYIIEIIEKYSLDNISDLHFHTGEVPYKRQNGIVSKIESDDSRVVTDEDLKVFMQEISLPSEKLSDLKEKGACDFGYQLSELNNLRLNFYYEQKKLGLAIRILKGKIPDFEALNLPETMKKVLNAKSGLVLVTGLTGNGKSTTIAALVNLINKEKHKHIITIEDPIEYRYPKAESFVTQREVPTDCSSFAEGLRSALRQDPDVIVIGEMRDKETISVTLEAAESGHLVFSTLHTSSASASIDRLVSYFSEEEQASARAKLASVLIAVFSQKLIPSIDETKMLPAIEILFSNIAINALIREGKVFQITNYIKLNSESDMITLEDTLANMVKAEKISYENALINANDADSFNNALKFNPSQEVKPPKKMLIENLIQKGSQK